MNSPHSHQAIKCRINPVDAEFVRLIDGNIPKAGTFVLTKPSDAPTTLSIHSILVFYSLTLNQKKWIVPKLKRPEWLAGVDAIDREMIANLELFKAVCENHPA